MALSREKSEPLRLRATADGLHLDNSILWFDACNSGQLSFLSAATDAARTFVPQIIATEETIKVLEVFHRRPNALVCQYNRPFSIGQLKLELLPSGHAFGGASLYLEIDKNHNLLYAPNIQTAKIPTLRQGQLRRARTLVLRADHADFALSANKNRQRHKEELVAATAAAVAASTWPHIFCQTLPTAQEITKSLTEAGLAVAVHSQIYKVNKVYEAYSSTLGAYSLHSRRRTKNKVVLAPLTARNLSRSRSRGEGPIFIVQHASDTQDNRGARSNGSDRCFYLNDRAFGLDYQEVIERVRPKELYFFGPAAQHYCDHYGKLPGVSVQPLFSNGQPPLF